MTMLTLAMATLVVPDYDEAIAYFTGRLGFSLVEDTPLGDGKRWVVVAPGAGARILLARASDAVQANAIGNQAGGRVGFFLHTDDFDTTVADFSAAGVQFAGAPRTEAYGRIVVIVDLYGNKWDLIEPASRTDA